MSAKRREPETETARSGGARPVLWLAAGFAFLLVAAAGVVAGGYYWLEREFTEPGPAGPDETVMIEPGSGLIRIANTLEREGLISDAFVFRAMVSLEGGEGDLRAGEYAIPEAASMETIYRILLEGETIQYPVTAAEGLTSAMIVRLVEAHPMLTGETGPVPPEGSLLPETYMVPRGTPRRDVIERMAEAQDRLLAELWPQRDPDLPFDTVEEAIILASIVEKETGVAEERPLVASVFVNRMRRGMRLQSDPTIIYGLTQGEPLGRGIRRSELESLAGGYNTYQIDGLPPTPIANPGEASIRAVLNPPESDYLYFVADGTGGHVFAETLAEHNRNVAAWRRIERQGGGR